MRNPNTYSAPQSFDLAQDRFIGGLACLILLPQQLPQGKKILDKGGFLLLFASFWGFHSILKFLILIFAVYLLFYGLKY